MGNLILEKKAFGKEDWDIHTGSVGDSPIIPEIIFQVLQSPCPFWEGKKIWQTHRLVLVPAILNGKPLTLNRIMEVVKIPPYTGNKQELETRANFEKDAIEEMRKREGLLSSDEGGDNHKRLKCFNYQNEHIKTQFGDLPIEKSYWMLMAKKPLHESLGNSLVEHKLILDSIIKRTPIDYQIPTAIEAVISVLAEILGSRKEPESHSEKYMICQETCLLSPVLVGGYCPSKYIEGKVYSGTFCVLTANDFDESKRPYNAYLYLLRRF